VAINGQNANSEQEDGHKLARTRRGTVRFAPLFPFSFLFFISGSFISFSIHVLSQIQ